MQKKVHEKPSRSKASPEKKKQNTSNYADRAFVLAQGDSFSKTVFTARFCSGTEGLKKVFPFEKSKIVSPADAVRARTPARQLSSVCVIFILSGIILKNYRFRIFSRISSAAV